MNALSAMPLRDDIVFYELVVICDFDLCNVQFRLSHCRHADLEDFTWSDIDLALNRFGLI